MRSAPKPSSSSARQVSNSVGKGRATKDAALIGDADSPHVVFERVRRDDVPAFRAAMRIYSESISLDEQQTELMLRVRVRQGINELYVGRLAAKMVFMALLWPLEGTDLVLLDYMATQSAYRSRGIGSAFLGEMIPRLAKAQKSLLIEVDHPSYGNDRKIRERRLNFYRRNGARELGGGVRYAIPPIHGGYSHKPMVLLLCPPTAEGTIAGRTVYSAVRQLYRQLYGRGSGDETLRMIEESIPTTVPLV